ncbi:MAG: DNA polymerase III subunit delta [Candidatus Izimaplasma sp.]|nr:DNA polymerase III subunit delta [Candidatus Izimaplasma bacterium]
MSEKIYVFYGEDFYIIKSKTKNLLKKYDINEYNTTTYDAEETNIESAINDASTIPFMADKKAIIVKNVYFLANTTTPKKAPNHNLEAFKRYIKNPVNESILIIQAPYDKLDNRKKLTKLIKEHATVEHCEPLKQQDLRGWVQRQLGKHNIKIEPKALNELLNRVENDTEVLVNETTKLVLYAGDMSVVDLHTVKLVITKNVEDNVYEITNNVLDNNRSKALEIYNDLIMHSEDPLRILGILVNKYLEILHTKTLLRQGKDKGDIADYFNASSGRTYYIMKNARSVDETIVRKHLITLEDIDYKIKTGQIDKTLGIELFILGT